MFICVINYAIENFQTNKRRQTPNDGDRLFRSYEKETGEVSYAEIKKLFAKDGIAL